MFVKIPNDSLTEIISSHAFYAAVVIFIGITCYHAIPTPVWNVVFYPICSILVSSLVMTGLSLCNAIRLHKVINLANFYGRIAIDGWKENDKLDEDELIRENIPKLKELGDKPVDLNELDKQMEKESDEIR